MRKKIEKVKKELDPIIDEITSIAGDVVDDYTLNPSGSVSGSVVYVHPNSPSLDD